jgi:hypothetical protein
MLRRTKFAVCPETHAKYIYTAGECRILGCKPGGTYSTVSAAGLLKVNGLTLNCKLIG